MRIIGHLDMDAFFAAVEERDREWLRGKPVIVGADPKGGKGRGVVSTANYKAREYGVHSAMPISKAWRLCPNCIFLGGNFKKYSEVSEKIMAILRKFSPVVEVASVDEAYFEINGDWKEAEKIAKKIKNEILEKEQLSCSVGIGPNKLIAKIASDFKKPDGLTIVAEEEAEKFLEPLPIRKIPGVGPKTEKKLEKMGIKTVKDAKKFSREELPHLYDPIRGQDDSPLVTEWEAKSIGEEETFEEDTKEAPLLVGCFESLLRQMFGRFKKSGFRGFRTISIKVRFGDFETKTRAHTLKAPASNLAVLRKEAMKLFLPFLDRRENPKEKLFRLLGVRVEKLK
ncbi:MAG: DNA polymerase IV [Patescibacteria group bacterium]